MLDRSGNTFLPTCVTVARSEDRLTYCLGI